MARLSDQVLLQLYARGKAPDRDYYGLTITNSELVLNVWRITYGPHVYPRRQKWTLFEFSKSSYAQNEVRIRFGDAVCDYINKLLTNEIKLDTLSTKVFHRVLNYLSARDVLNLSHTSKILFERCNMERSWSLVFRNQWKHDPTRQEQLTISTHGWKEAIFDKLGKKVASAIKKKCSKFTKLKTPVVQDKKEENRVLILKKQTFQETTKNKNGEIGLLNADSKIEQGRVKDWKFSERKAKNKQASKPIMAQRVDKDMRYIEVNKLHVATQKNQSQRFFQTADDLDGKRIPENGTKPLSFLSISLAPAQPKLTATSTANQTCSVSKLSSAVALSSSTTSLSSANITSAANHTLRANRPLTFKTSATSGANTVPGVIPASGIYPVSGVTPRVTSALGSCITYSKFATHRSTKGIKPISSINIVSSTNPVSSTTPALISNATSTVTTSASKIKSAACSNKSSHVASPTVPERYNQTNFNHRTKSESHQTQLNPSYAGSTPILSKLSKDKFQSSTVTSYTNLSATNRNYFTNRPTRVASGRHPQNFVCSSHIGNGATSAGGSELQKMLTTNPKDVKIEVPGALSLLIPKVGSKLKTRGSLTRMNRNSAKK